MTESVLDQVRQRAYDEAGALPAVALRPVDTVGHVLREELFARHDLPAHDVVTVEGWAVAGPGPWQLVAANPPEAAVPDGAAVAVAAGDELPPGTSAVVSRHDATIATCETVAAAMARSQNQRGAASNATLEARSSELAASQISPIGREMGIVSCVAGASSNALAKPSA